jgi:hypothetical protein
LVSAEIRSRVVPTCACVGTLVPASPAMDVDVPVHMPHAGAKTVPDDQCPTNGWRQSGK